MQTPRIAWREREWLGVNRKIAVLSVLGAANIVNILYSAKGDSAGGSRFVPSG